MMVCVFFFVFGKVVLIRVSEVMLMVVVFRFCVFCVVVSIVIEGVNL